MLAKAGNVKRKTLIELEILARKDKLGGADLKVIAIDYANCFLRGCCRWWCLVLAQTVAGIEGAGMVCIYCGLTSAI